MAVYTIFWPWEVNPDIKDFLREKHHIPWAEVVSYADQKIHPTDIEGIRRFLQEHKEPDQFVYVAGESHVAVVYEDKFCAGWAWIDHEGYIRNLYHHIPGRNRSHISCLEEVWRADPPLRPIMPMPSYRM